jgi:hypothetical protein
MTRKQIVSYLAVTATFLALLLIAPALYRSAKSNVAAEEKAERLIARLDEVGLAAPSKQQIIRVLGDDGGAFCVDPTSALKEAMRDSQLSNGAGGPGQRPVIAAAVAIRGELAIIEVYCPEQLSEVRDRLDDLKLTDRAEG